MGFTFDDTAAAKGEAESLATMRALMEKNPRNAERIFPYIGGEEVNNDPRHAHHRYVIDFADFPLRRDPTLKSWFLNEGSEACYKRRREWLRIGIVPDDYPDQTAADWPEILDIVRRLVKPGRDKDKRPARRYRWWRFGDRQPGLYVAIAPLERVLVTNAQATPHSSFVLLQKTGVFANSLNIVAFDRWPAFAVLQSIGPYECWARFFGSTLEDRLRYNPTDCFETFPFPENFATLPALEAIGHAYHDSSRRADGRP